MPQTVTVDETTLSLVKTTTSPTHFVIEFVIKHPLLPPTLEEMTDYNLAPMPVDEMLALEGFDDTTGLSNVSVNTRREAGQIRLALELPPLAGKGPHVITIKQLRLSVDIPAEERSQFYDLTGPWQFTVKPQAGAAAVRRLPLDLQQRSSDILVTVQGDMQLAETETLVPYWFSSEAGEVASLSAPVLTVNGEPLHGRERDNTTAVDAQAEQAGNRWLSFPPVPDSVSQVSLTLGPFMVDRAVEQQITLAVAQLQNGGQIVQIDGQSFRFTLDEGDGPGLTLTYVPLDEKGSRIMLRGLSSGEPLQAVDDLGTQYTEAGGTADFTPDEHSLLKSHTIEFAEPLLDNVKEITLTSQFTGFIVDAVTFDIPLDN
ncbi:MAG: hypothetical protein P8183_18065 [Anaerolineae bacterium]